MNKRRVAAVLSIIMAVIIAGTTLTAIAPQISTVVAAETLVKYTTTDDLNYRTSPSTTASKGGMLKKGASVDVVSGYTKAADGHTWYKLKISGKYYYASSAYLKKTSTETLVKYVTTDELNYRKSPSTSGAKAGMLKKGAQVDVVSGYSKSANGYTWYKLKINGSYYYGVSSYLKKYTATTTATTKETLVKYVTTDELNYRKSPSTSGAKAGMLKKGAQVDVVSGYSKSANGYKWYKIKIGSSYYYAVASYLKKYSAPAITLSSSSITLYEKGAQKTLTATTNPKSTVKWSSGNTAVATVTSGGVVKPVKAGTATITAKTSAGKTAKCTVTVKPLSFVKYVNTAKITYYSSRSTSKTVGSISKNTIIECVNGSSYTTGGIKWFTIKYNNKYYYVDSKNLVKYVAATGVKLSSSSLTMYVGGNDKKLTATVSPTNATFSTVSWSSNNTAVATVDTSGNVKPVAKGTATITAKTADDKSAKCTVTVNPKTYDNYVLSKKLSYYNGSFETCGTLAVGEKVSILRDFIKTKDGVSYYKAKINGTHYYIDSRYMYKEILPTKLTLSQSEAELYVSGNKLTLTASFTPSDTTAKDIVWESSDSSVAAVTEKGVVQAVKEGTAVITATGANNIKASCTVKVNARAYEDYYNPKALDYYNPVTTKQGTIPAGEHVQIVVGYKGTSSGVEYLKANISGKLYFVKADEVKPKEIVLAYTSKNAYVGDTFKLNGKVMPESNGIVTYKSSNTAVATVDASGKVTAKAQGSAAITATADGMTSTCTVTVTNKNYVPYYVTADGTNSLNYRDKPAISGSKILGQKSQYDVIYCLDGWTKNADGVKWYQFEENGQTCYVAAFTLDADGNKVDQYVKKMDADKQIALDTTSMTLAKGTYYNLKAILAPTNSGTVKWSSSDTAVAKVDSAGKVTAVKGGTATITCTAPNGKSVTCKVTVTEQIEGVDVSAWQKDVDFKKVKADGIKFVMLRAGYGKYTTDAYFEQNYKNAKAQGLKVGVYWFSYATTVEEAKQEAQTCLAALKGKTLDYPVYYDWEYDSEENYRAIYKKSPSKSLTTSFTKTFCDEIKKGGFTPGVYTNVDCIEKFFDMSKLNYSLWLAQWFISKPTMDCEIWQYSDCGKVNGIEGNVDMDRRFN